MTDDVLGPPPLPSAFRPHASTAIDPIVAASWDAVRPIAGGLHDYDRNRLTNAAGYFLPAMFDAGLVRSDLTWLEIGSGIGMKSLPIAAAVGRYIAVEYDVEQSERAASLARSCGLRSIQHVAANAADVAADPGRFDVPGQVDVLLLYAVLEHLLPEERSPIYGLMSEVLARGGAVVVMETPNRLIPYDSHTTQLHFFHMLPDDLAIEYTARSARAEMREPLARAAAEDRRTVLYRNGRGLSYHDFEIGLGLDSIDQLPVRVDGFGVHLLNQEPVGRQELALCRYLTDNDLPAGPSFGRSWIDVAAGHGLPEHGTGPSTLAVPRGGRFTAYPGSTFWSLDGFRAGADGHLVFDLRPRHGPTVTVLVDLAGSSGQTEVLDVDDRHVAIIDIERLRRSRTPTWHDTVAIELATPGDVLVLRPTPGSVLHGYGVLH